MDERPDPEELLTRYHLHDSDAQSATVLSNGESDRDSGRGRLRVYLGAAAGVGKTYAMLNEGYRRKERGTDVVVGYVETHKRPQTEAQLHDLEIVPRKKVPYRNIYLEEMDIDAILARHPQVVLVDELAHTNVVGSKNAKRYQDALDLLDAGIDVVTTLNVQHLESLNDLVASITGVRVRETLPDRILDRADEVELVDIAPNALRQRMRHGNIYPPERIQAALDNFFREGNLSALREIALRLTADKAETQLEAYMTGHHIDQAWAATERVMVAFDARPRSRQVIRDAWRLAHSLHADLFAIHVEAVGYQGFMKSLTSFVSHRINTGHNHSRSERLQLLSDLGRFAEDLGAIPLSASGNDIARVLIAEANARHITQLVLGLPVRSRWEELLSGSVINRVLRLNKEMRIHLVPYKKE